MKALRTIPVMSTIADAVRDLARPDAWLLDFTNPVGIVTRSLLDRGSHAVGLCNYAIGMQRWAAQVLDVDHARVEVDPVGLNHFSWTREIRLDGESVFDEVLDRAADEIPQRFGFPMNLVRSLGAIPSYYLAWYYYHDARVRKLQHERSRAEDVAEIEAELMRMYQDPHLVTKPPQLEKRGGAYYSEAALSLMASLTGLKPARHVINLRNGQTVPGLREDDVIETLCDVDGDALTPVPQAPLDPVMLGPVQHVTAYETLLVKASRTRTLGDLKLALLAHPLLGQVDVIDDLVPELVAASRPYLEGFES